MRLLATATAALLLLSAGHAAAHHLPPDYDGDGVLDADDNCPLVPNGPNDPTGQPNWGNQAESAQYPGVGCACICGDANRDCLVNVSDASEAQRAGLVPPLPALGQHFDRRFCDINSDASCDVSDAPDMQRAGLVPPLSPLSATFDVTGCPGYLGAPPGSFLNVMDANGSHLGPAVSYSVDGTSTFFVVGIGAIVIAHETGRIQSAAGPGLFFDQPDCQGTAYASTNPRLGNGVLVALLDLAVGPRFWVPEPVTVVDQSFQSRGAASTSDALQICDPETGVIPTGQRLREVSMPFSVPIPVPMTLVVGR